jgi:hypothetical protein
MSFFGMFPPADPDRTHRRPGDSGIILRLSLRPSVSPGKRLGLAGGQERGREPDSGPSPQCPGARARVAVDDHPVMEPGDGSAAGTHAEPRNYRVYETRERGEEQRKPECQRMALMLQIRLPDGAWVLEK